MTGVYAGLAGKRNPPYHQPKNSECEVRCDTVCAEPPRAMRSIVSLVERLQVRCDTVCAEPPRAMRSIVSLVERLQDEVREIEGCLDDHAAALSMLLSPRPEKDADGEKAGVGPAYPNELSAVLGELAGSLSVIRIRLRTLTTGLE